MSKIIGVTVGTTISPEKLKELGDLNITVTDIKESSEDGGSNVVTFSDGTSLTVKNGSKGSKGDTGRAPVKGEDYFTAADKAEMVSAVIASLPVYNGEVVTA